MQEVTEWHFACAVRWIKLLFSLFFQFYYSRTTLRTTYVFVLLTYCIWNKMFKNGIENYSEFCKRLGLRQSIESPAHITFSTSSIISHILASVSDKETQWEISNVGLSDQQLIYCTRNRSSCPEVLCKKGVLRNFVKLTGKHLCQSLFFNNVTGLRPATTL